MSNQKSYKQFITGSKHTLYQDIAVIWTETEAEDMQASPSQLWSHQCVTSIQTVHHLCKISSWTETAPTLDNCIWHSTQLHTLYCRNMITAH